MNHLFQIQTDLIDTKVNMAASNAIDRVVEQINNLRHEMHTEINGLKNDMNKRFSSLEQRVTAVETKLGLVNETQREIRNKFIDYSFKAGWLILGITISFFMMQLHALVK